MINKFRSQKGFSLVQVIVSLGLFSGVLYMAFKLINDQTRLGTNSSEGFEIINIQDQIRSLLSDGNICSETFKDVSIQENETITAIKGIDQRGAESNFFEVFSLSSQYYGQKNIQITKMEFIPLKGEEGKLRGEGHLWVTYRKSKQTFGKKSVRRKMKVFLGVDPDGRVVNCFTVPGKGVEGFRSRSGVWVKAGAKQVLYYDEGPVVIGNREVKTGVNLNLEGALRIGDTSLSCIPNVAGALKFNQREKKFQECSPQGQWQDIQYGERVDFSVEKVVSVSVKGKQLVTEVANEFYSLCQLNTLQDARGLCQTEYSGEKQKWIFQAEGYGLGRITCQFKCHPQLKQFSGI